MRFCERFLDKRDRTVDQMVQAARSGKQNILEGSQASGTSKETEIKLVNVARASLEELPGGLPRLSCAPAAIRSGTRTPRKHYSSENSARGTMRPYESYKTYIDTRPPEIVANILICLIHQTNYLLDQQLRALEQAFPRRGRPARAHDPRPPGSPPQTRKPAMKLPPYPRTKPSGVEWLGDVPEHWEVKRLRRHRPSLTKRQTSPRRSRMTKSFHCSIPVGTSSSELD